MNQTLVKKQSLRTQARNARRELTDRDERANRITRQMLESAEYRSAQTILLYVSIRDEVCTTGIMDDALGKGKAVVVPYSHQTELRLFRLSAPGELEPGMYGISEPRMELRSSTERVVHVSELELVVVPGVAFDESGARCGHGMGYYDKLLQHVSSRAHLVALAFDCQVFPEIPFESHDVFMDKIVTETRIYCRGEA